MRRQVAHERGSSACRNVGVVAWRICAPATEMVNNGLGTTIFLSCPRWRHQRNVLDMSFVPTGHVNVCSVLSGKIAKDKEHTYMHTRSNLRIYMCIYFNGVSRGFEYIYYAGSCWTHLARITFALRLGSDLCAPKYSSENMFNGAYYWFQKSSNETDGMGLNMRTDNELNNRSTQSTWAPMPFVVEMKIPTRFSCFSWWIIDKSISCSKECFGHILKAACLLYYAGLSMKLVEPTLRMSNARVIERVHAPRFLYPWRGLIHFGQAFAKHLKMGIKYI